MTPTTSVPEAASPARDSNSNSNNDNDNDNSSATPQKQVACQRCKLRKAKCDRRVPKCERCRDANVPCVYARTRRPPGFPMGHRQLLEGKIRRLEGELTHLRRGENVSVQGDARRSATEPGLSVAMLDADGAARQENTTPSGSAPPQDREHSQGPDEAWSNAGRNSDSAGGSPSWREKPSAPTVVRTGRIKELKPPDDLVLSLTSLYFRHVHHWLPFLDVRHIFSDHGALGEPSLITYALFGATLQYSQDPRLTQSSRDAFWKYCKRTVMVEALEEPSYHTLEALTVLALDLSGLTHGPQVWGVLAVAVKMAQQLDTSGSGNAALRTSSATEEASGAPVADQSAVRRLFWAIYALDCYVAITTRHASELSGEAIQNLFPFRSTLWQQESTAFNGVSTSDVGQLSPEGSSSRSLAAPTTQAIFGYQLELLDISKRLHSLYIDFVRFETSGGIPPDGWIQSVSDWSDRMETWFTQLPSTLRIAADGPNAGLEQQRPVSPLVASLNVYYYGLRIYLHGLGDFMTHPHQPSETHFASFAKNSRVQCLTALERMTRIAGSLFSRGPCADRLGWPFAWALWIGGRYCLASRYRNRPLAPRYFEKTAQALKGLSLYWQVAGHYLRLLHISQGELDALGTPGSQAAPNDLLLSVVDWRIASSEVEDKGRVDPILRSTGLAPLEKGIDFYNIQMMLASSTMGVPSGPTAYNEPMTDWFSVSSMRQEQEEMHQSMSDLYGLNPGYGA